MSFEISFAPQSDVLGAIAHQELEMLRDFPGDHRDCVSPFPEANTRKRNKVVRTSKSNLHLTARPEKPEGVPLDRRRYESQ